MLPEYLTIALQTLRANPLRTLLSTLGVVIGVGSLVSILALVDGMEAFARADIEGTTDLQVITVSIVTTERLDGLTLRRLSYPVFAPADAAELQTRLGNDAGVGLLASYASIWSAAADTARQQALVSAMTPALFALRPPELVAGRLFTDADMEQRLAVLSAGAAARLAADTASAVGVPIKIGDAEYRVVGVASLGETGTIARISIPVLPPDEMPGAQDPRPAQLVVRATRVEDVPQVRAAVESWLAARWDTAGGTFAVSSNVARVAQASRAILVFKLVMGTIAGISLIVGGIGIMNVLLASVTERTREIGIRRASGARQRDIHRQFLAESMAISAVGSGLGAVLGVVVSTITLYVVGRMAEVQVRAVFAWESLGFAMGAAVLVGLLFGMYPAKRAGRLSPIEALRHE